MAEFAGLGYYAEVPVVIFDIQRIGPSTGLPTRTSQADVGFAYTLSHGDTKHLVLLPGTVEECYEFARDAFDYADRFQTPVFVLSDLDLGMNLWMTPEFKYPDKPFDRGKVLSKADLERLAGEWARYRDVDGDGVPYRTLPGTDHPAAGYFTRGSGHDERARYTESSEAYGAESAAGAGDRRVRRIADRPHRVRVDACGRGRGAPGARRGEASRELPARARPPSIGRCRRVRLAT